MDPPDVLFRPVDYFDDDESVTGVNDLSTGVTSLSPAINATVTTTTAASVAKIADLLLPTGLVICTLVISVFFAVWALIKSRQNIATLPGMHRIRYGIVTSSVATEPVGGSIKTVRSSGTGGGKGTGGAPVVSAAPVALTVN